MVYMNHSEIYNQPPHGTDSTQGNTVIPSMDFCPILRFDSRYNENIMLTSIHNHRCQHIGDHNNDDYKRILAVSIINHVHSDRF